MPNLTASLENYLETILSIYEENQTIKAIEISKRLSVSKASVTEALRALSSKGLINYAPYEDITLTKTGSDKAKKIAHKHEVLYGFLSDILKIEKNEAIENACRIEHVISENVFKKFVDFLEFNKIFHCDKHDYVKEFHSFSENKRKK